MRLQLEMVSLLLFIDGRTFFEFSEALTAWSALGRLIIAQIISSMFQVFIPLQIFVISALEVIRSNWIVIWRCRILVALT